MRKIWYLYIIFIVFFLFGDLFSTYVAMHVEKSSIAEVVKIPEECICRVPPKCDASPAIQESSFSRIFLGKIILSLLGLIFVYYNLTPVLALFVFYSVFATFHNLSIVLYPLKSVMLLAGGIINAIITVCFLKGK